MDEQSIKNEWVDIVSNFEMNYFKDWNMMEVLFGELGEPGFSEKVMALQWPTINPEYLMDYTFTQYRDEDGLLVGVFANYIIDGVLIPFILIVHPDYQRTGIGTLLADFVIHAFEEKYSKTFLFHESWNNLPIVTEQAANWANKYVKNRLSI
jgi:GNAT superfamily N-acetyltransferase